MVGEGGATSDTDRAHYVRRVGRVAFANTFVSAVIAVGATPLLIRLVGLERFGLWAVVVSMSEVAALVDLGVGKSIAVDLAARRGTEEEHVIASIAIRLISSIWLSLSIVACALLLVGIGSNTSVVAAAVAALAAYLTSGLLRSLMEGLFALDRAQFLSLAETFAVYSAAGLAWLASDDGRLTHDLLLWSPAAALLVVQFSQLVWLRRAVRQPSFGFVAPRELKGLVGRSGGFMTLGLLNSAFRPSVRAAFFGLGGSSAGHAVLDVALRVARVSYGLLSSFSVGALTAYSGTLGLGRAVRAVRPVVRRLLWVYAVLAAMGIALSGPGFAWLTGVEPSSTLLGGFVVAVGGNALLGVTEPFVRVFMGHREIRPLMILKLIQYLALGVLLVGLLQVTGDLVQILLYSVGGCCGVLAVGAWLQAMIAQRGPAS